MKQIDTCLDRLFSNQKPLRQKWQVVKSVVDNVNVLNLYHYQHLILIYDLDKHEAVYSWHECPTDKRGLDAALEYLNIKFSSPNQI